MSVSGENSLWECQRCGRRLRATAIPGVDFDLKSVLVGPICIRCELEMSYCDERPMFGLRKPHEQVVATAIVAYERLKDGLKDEALEMARVILDNGVTPNDVDMAWSTLQEVLFPRKE